MRFSMWLALVMRLFLRLDPATGRWSGRVLWRILRV